MAFRLLDKLEAAEWCSRPHKVVAFDTETKFIPELPDALVVTIHGNPNNYPFLFTFSTEDEDVAIYLTPDNYGAIATLLANPDVMKLGFHAKFDIHMAMNVGMAVRGPVVDVMIQHHLVDEEDPPADWDGKDNFSAVRNLKGLATKYIDPEADKYETAVDDARKLIAKETGRKKEQVGYDEVPAEIMVPYACADTQYTYTLWKMWVPEIAAQGLERLMEEEHEALWACVGMERTGYWVDEEYLKQQYQQLKFSADSTAECIYVVAGTQFNIDSADELVAVFQSLGAEYVAMTDKGAYQTDEDALAPWLDSPIENVAELAKLVLQYREDSKLLNTYVLGILENIKHYPDKRVRCDFTQAFAVTGRMSATKPNLQNLPRNDLRIRKAFRPSKDYIMLYADYDGQEVRIFMHYLMNWELIRKVVDEKLNFHKLVASMMFNIPYDEVTKEQRSAAKEITFGLIYGMGNLALAKAIGLTSNASKTEMIVVKYGSFSMTMSLWDKDMRDQAGVYKKMYFRAIEGAQSLIKQVNSAGKRRGYIFNYFGRRRRIKDDRTYRYINSLIQGMGADVMKTTLGRLHRFLEDKKSRLVLPVHDEVHIELHKSELHLIPEIKAIMEDFDFKVPMVVEMQWSDSDWATKRPMSELVGV